jgi:hypothetical protein
MVRWGLAPCLPGAVIKEQFPLLPLHAAEQHFLGRALAPVLLAQVDKVEGVPPARLELKAEVLRILRQGLEDRMGADATEPVRRISGIPCPDSPLMSPWTRRKPSVRVAATTRPAKITTHRLAAPPLDPEVVRRVGGCGVPPEVPHVRATGPA